MWPKPKTKIYSRWDLFVIAQESMPRMKVSSFCLAEALRDGLKARVTIPKIRLERISIAKTSDKEES